MYSLSTRTITRNYGSSRSSSSCFQSHWQFDSNFYARYAAMITFLAVYVGTLIALCVIRKRTDAGKRLIGIPYMLALLFMFIQQAIAFLSTTLQACDVGTSTETYYSWSIASYVFYGLETMLLLYVVIWMLNTMLRKQLSHNPSALRNTLLADLVVLGVLLMASVVLYCYGNWVSMESFSNYRRFRDFNYLAVYIVDLVFWCVYLISIIASGILALLAVQSLKTKRVAGSSLIIWVPVLYLSLFVYSLISVIQISSILHSRVFSEASYVAMYWISSICRALAFIAVIFIARDAVWTSNEFAAGAPLEHGDHWYNYEHDPIYNGVGQRA